MCVCVWRGTLRETWGSGYFLEVCGLNEQQLISLCSSPQSQTRLGCSSMWRLLVPGKAWRQTGVLSSISAVSLSVMNFPFPTVMSIGPCETHLSFSSSSSFNSCLQVSSSKFSYLIFLFSTCITVLPTSIPLTRPNILLPAHMYVRVCERVHTHTHIYLFVHSFSYLWSIMV